MSKSFRSRPGLGTALPAFLLPLLFSVGASAQVEEIIVTAERREASIQDVPVAVSAYNDETLQALQVEDTLDLINVVPNLFGGNNTGIGSANMYYIRAQGNDESISTFDPPVGTYIDGVYVSRQNANNFTLFDVERIEVLRGPQGTLFGRNTTGGAINVVLKDPAPETGGFVEAGFGRYGEYRMRGSVDIPVSETFLTKFSAYHISSDGWLENRNPAIGGDYNVRDSIGLRADLRYMPTDMLTWDLTLEYIDDEAGNIHGDLVGDDRVSTSVAPLGAPTAAFDFLNFSITGGFVPLTYQQKADYGSVSQTTSIISDLTYAAPAGELEFIVGWRDLEQDFFLNFPNAPGDADDFFWIDNNGVHEQFTAEVKWSARYFDDRLDFVSGVFYLDEDNETDFADWLLGSFVLADRVMENTTESWAVYAQGDYALSDKWTLTVGARYTDEQKEISITDNLGNRGIIGPPLTLETENLIAAGIPVEQEESIVTPRVALKYDYSDDLMVYASATRGFKSGGWNAREATAPTMTPFGPEKLWAYELGFRGDMFGDLLRANGTFFYTDLEDLQTTSASDGNFLTTNAGGLEVTGFELEVNAVPTDWLNLFVSLGLQDAEYVDIQDQIAECQATPPDEREFAALDFDCNVADPKRSPDWTLTVGAFLDFPIPAFGASLQPNVSTRFIGPNVVGTSQRGENDTEVITNAGISLVDDEGVWSVTAECNNCSDEEYITSFLFTPYWTPPMTWQVRGRWNFGTR
ncbi:TonB-dependent receptor [Lentisalinibacter sediminis]|uniref:TonB-dependent receptor n=1 Tax=Lentisalinibacter sediminis TaxID=2992237 RepID=UPI0038687417